MTVHTSALYLLLTILCTSSAPQNASSDEKAKRFFANLQLHISRHDEVALATWKGYWSAENLFLLREFPLAASLWTLPRTSFLRYIKRNANAGLKTNVVAISLGKDALKYLKDCPTRPVDVALLDCLFIEKGAAGGTTSNDMRILNARTLSCDRSRICSEKGSAIQCLRLPQARDLSASTRECHSFSVKTSSRHLHQSQLRNQVIHIGCVKTDRHETSCQSSHTGFVLRALRFYNVSLKWSFSRDKRAIVNAVICGDRDIMGNGIILNYRMSIFFDTHQIISLGDDVFYVKSATTDLTSFVNILVESKLALCLLLVALTCASLALSLADLKEINPCQLNSVMDSFLCLLASFYATSLPIRHRRNSLWARTVVYSLWFLAILPFSNYFRSELVSRLSVRSHEDVMDTLDELHDALSRKTVIPCLRVGSLIHHCVTTNLSYTNVQAKLSLAFYAAKDRSSLETVNSADCLSCAKQKDHVCFTDRLSGCFQEQSHGFVESRDTLNLVLRGMIVRKNFPLKVAFRNLVYRIREAGFFGEQKLCVSRSANNDDTATLLESDQLTELSRFLTIFALFLAGSSLVLVFEVIEGNL